MLRRCISLFIVAFVMACAGCVPVTDPVGDITKAEPKKDLIGTWRQGDIETWVVDRPEVKGNPKGLMRIRTYPGNKKHDDEAKDTVWFFMTTLGKHTYGNLLIYRGGNNLYADLSKEGEYAEWAKANRRGFWVGHLTIENDKVILHGGDKNAFAELMTKEKIAEKDGYYMTAEWLAGYLEKKGPGAIFAGSSNKAEFTRVKE